MPESSTRVRRGVAEFVLIAVGVFVGLAADEWRQTRNDREEEGQYVRRLLVDLADDSSAHDALESRSVAKIPALLRLAATERLSDPDLAAQAAVDLTDATLSFTWSAFPLRRNTFNELVSTGRLSLIQDPELRESIAAYYSLAENYAAALLRRREAIGLGQIALNYVLTADVGPPEGRPPAQLNDLIRQLDVIELRKAATAELNYLAISRQFTSDLADRRQIVIDRLRQVQATE